DDSNAYRPCHTDESHSLHSIPRQLAIDHDDDLNHGNRCGSAILAARTAFRLCSATVAVLAIFGGNARLLRSANPNRKGVATEKVVDLIIAVSESMGYALGR